MILLRFSTVSFSYVLAPSMSSIGTGGGTLVSMANLVTDSDVDGTDETESADDNLNHVERFVYLCARSLYQPLDVNSRSHH